MMDKFDGDWIGEPAKIGERVLVKNYNGRKLYEFVCKALPNGSLYLEEAKPGEAKKLVGISVSIIGYGYCGLKVAIKDGQP